ncbi:MAG: aldo/keto reductase [Thermoanaerobaculia bacterium]
MKRTQLAPGLSVSRVLTGLWQIADMERDGRELDSAAAAEAMKPYAEAGLTTFDMADHYGSAEVIAGIFRERYAGAADSVQLLTKWVPKPGPVTRDEVREAVERALERLRTDRLDLLQFHAWSYSDPSYLDCLFHLQELRAEGLIRHLGLTNFDTAHLRLVIESGIEVVSNQVCFSLLDRRAARGMAELCRERGIGILAYGTLAGGLLTERWMGRPEPDIQTLATWSQMKYKRFLEAAGGWEKLQGVLGATASVAERLGVSMANVACRWILENSAVAGIIVGARLGESEHIEENLRLFDFALDERSRAQIDEALDALEEIPGDCGDEYRRPPFLTASGDLSHHFEDMPAPYAVRRDGDTAWISSGTHWEELAGYSRAVRQGRRILVSGTTATHGERLIGGTDPAGQATFILDKIEGAIRSLGGRMEDVRRTRVYVSRISDWEAVARAHGRRFRDIRPANTLVEARLVGDQYLVEMEAEALASEPS